MGKKRTLIIKGIVGWGNTLPPFSIREQLDVKLWAAIPYHIEWLVYTRKDKNKEKNESGSAENKKNILLMYSAVFLRFSPSFSSVRSLVFFAKDINGNLFAKFRLHPILFFFYFLHTGLKYDCYFPALFTWKLDMYIYIQIVYGWLLLCVMHICIYSWVMLLRQFTIKPLFFRIRDCVYL